MTDYRKECYWPDGGKFHFYDSPGEHDPCYVVMPGGAMIPLNHHAGEGVDIARAKFIIKACNTALKQPHRCDRCGEIETSRRRRCCTLEECPLQRTQSAIQFTDAEDEAYDKIEADEKGRFYEADRSGKISDE